MGKAWRARLLVAVLVVVAAGGCNPFTMFWFLIGGPEDKMPPEFPLTPEERGKEIKVLVMTSCSLDVNQEFIGIDRMLASEFTQALTEGCKANKEKVVIIPANQVEKYKSDHPNWRAQDPTKVGQHFEADYVIDLEVLGISLYPDKTRELLQGRAAINVNAYNLKKPDEEPRKTDYTVEFPRGRYEDASNTTPSKFRHEFVRRIAVDLSWKFTAHEYRDHFEVD
jgi:hypothetical protein